MSNKCQLNWTVPHAKTSYGDTEAMLAIATPFLNASQSDTALGMKKFCILSLLQTAFCLLYDILQSRSSEEVPTNTYTKLFHLLIDNAMHALSACLGWIIVLDLLAAKFPSSATAVTW